MTLGNVEINNQAEVKSEDKAPAALGAQAASREREE